jgi:hypothetical protein
MSAESVGLEACSAQRQVDRGGLRPDEPSLRAHQGGVAPEQRFVAIACATAGGGLVSPYDVSRSRQHRTPPCVGDSFVIV